MATLSTTISWFTIAAATYSSGAYKWNSVSKKFDLSDFPSKGTITAAKLVLKTDHRGSVRCVRTVGDEDVTINAYGDHYESGQYLDVLPLFSGSSSPVSWTATSITIKFEYKAATNQINHISGGSSIYDDIRLFITYTPPYSKCTAPTTVKLNKTAASLGQSLTLSWSGAKAGSNMSISKYRIYRATSKSGTYSTLATTTSTSHTVTAPTSAGSYYYKVEACSSYSSTYDSGMSSAYAAVTCEVTAPTAPGGAAVSPSSQYPDGTATFSWNASTPGTNNPIEGYEVSSAPGSSGPWTVLGTVSVRTYTVKAPQDGSLFLRVRAIGEYKNSAYSTVKELQTDLTNTSGFAILNGLGIEIDQAEAGDAITLALDSNDDKAHTLVVTVGTASDTESYAANIGDELSYSIPMSLLAGMPAAAQATMKLALTTAGAGTIYHTMTLICPADVVPTNVTGADSPVSDDVPSLWGVYVQDHSAVQVSITTPATQAYSSPIAKYTIRIGSQTYQSTATPSAGSPIVFTSAIQANPGDVTISVTATDKRGHAATTSWTVYVEPYAPPDLSDLRTVRADMNGDEDDEGTYGLATATIVCSACGEDGNQDPHNTATCSVAYRVKGSGAWTSAGDMVNGSLLFGNAGINTANNYEVRYTVTDLLGTTVIRGDIISRSVWEIHVAKGGGAWAFGGVADTPGSLHIWGGLKLDTALPISSGGTGANTKADAKTALDIDTLEALLGGVKLIKTTISANNGTAVFTFSGTCAFSILSSGADATIRQHTHGYCTSAGVVSETKNPSGATGVTFTNATNKLTVKNTSQYTMFMVLIAYGNPDNVAIQ